MCSYTTLIGRSCSPPTRTLSSRQVSIPVRRIYRDNDEWAHVRGHHSLRLVGGRPDAVGTLRVLMYYPPRCCWFVARAHVLPAASNEN